MKSHGYQVVTEESYGNGEIILEEGRRGNWVYVVESGAVELSKMVGEKKVVIEILRQGDVFGELDFITNTPRVATCRAMGKTVVGLVDRSSLDSEFGNLSENFRTIIRSLALRLEKLTNAASGAVIRRKDPRITKVLSLDYEKTGEFIGGWSTNISTGGVFVKTPKPYKMGETFILELHLPDNTAPIKAKCEVRWVRSGGDAPDDSGMGVKFVMMSDDDRNRLQDMIRSEEIGA